MIRRYDLLVALAIVLAACSSASESAVSEQTASTGTIEETATASTPESTGESETPDPASPESDVPSDETSADENSDDAGSTNTAEAPAPAVPNPEFDETPSTSSSETAWISRRSMSEEAIELVWTAEPGAASYEIHRLPETEARPDPTDMTEDNRIHSGEQSGTFIDADVEAEDRYWYGVRSIGADGALTSTGWHRAAAVDDDQPPSPVEFSLSVEDDAVSLSWAAPDENYELHAYRVLRAIDGAELETVVTTWNLDQTTFVDAEPPTGSVSYAVVAVDFHWNESDQTVMTTEVGS